MTIDMIIFPLSKQIALMGLVVLPICVLVLIAYIVHRRKHRGDK